MQVMWRAVEDELKSIKVENLGYDHPLCSGILDDCSTPFTEIPERCIQSVKQKVSHTALRDTKKHLRGLCFKRK